VIRKIIGPTGWNDNMKYQLVVYKVSDRQNNQYAVIPVSFLPDFLDWLQLSECAEVLSVTVDTTRTLSGKPEFRAPTDWPSYQTCVDRILISELLAHEAR